MSTQVHQRHNQGPKSNKVFNLYEQFQDVIRQKTGIECSVLVTPEYVSIRTKSYADYVLAKSCIRGMTGLNIVQG